MSISTITERTMKVCFYLLFILVPLFLTPWNYELFEYNKMLVTYGLAAIIVTAWIVRMIHEKEIKIPRTPFDIPLGLFVLSQFVSTIFSMDPHVSWFGYYSRFNGGFFSVITYTLLYYAFVSVFTIPKNPSHTGETLHIPVKKLLIVLLGIAGLVSLYGLAERLGIDKDLWVQDVQTRVFSTLGQPNWLAAYLVALIPASIVMSIREGSGKVKAILWNVLAILFFTVLLFTRSRSGLLAFGVTQLIFLLLFFRPRIGKTPQRFVEQVKNLPQIIRRITHLRTMVAVYGCMLIILFFNGTHTMTGIDRYFSFEGWKKILTERTANSQQQSSINQNIATPEEKTPQTITGTPNVTANTNPVGPSLETGGTESGIIRKYVWQAAINAWKSSPKTILIGTGTETFAFAFYAHKPIGHNLTSEWDFLYNKAHNEYLNYLATTGLFGLASYLSFIGSIIFFVYRKISNSMTDELHDHKNLFIALFVGWLSILVTNFFGFAVVIVEILFFLLPAMLIVLTKDRRWYARTLTLSDKKIRTVTVITFATGILIVGVLVLHWFADASFANGYHLSRAGRIGQSFAYLTRAVMLNPLEPLYHDERGNTLSVLALASQENGDATTAAALAKAAVTESDEAIRVSPNNINFWKTRTKILFTLSGIDENFLPNARDALVRAQVLSPGDPKIRYNLAIIEGRLGNIDSAITNLEKTIELKPNYRDGYYALYVFYSELGDTSKAKEILKSYLTLVDGSDEQFLKLMNE